jgi:hypothetical protein
VQAGAGCRAPREQAEVLTDVTGDPEQREAALVGAGGDLERVL